MGKRQVIFNYFYLLPILALVLFLFLYPVAYAVYISFTNFSLFHFFQYSYIGFKNYINILTNPNFYFVELLKNTAIWTIGSLIPMMILGFFLALILNQSDLKFKNVFFSSFLIPWAFPAYISLLIWSGMWDYSYGIINKIIGLIGIAPINWLNNTTYAWVALILTNVWLSFPYYTSIFLSALQSIPRELYEIAEVDGAGMLTRFARITLPMMKSTLVFVGVSGFIFTWNNFYPVFILTGGGPGTSTDILIVYSYQEAFSYNQYALASAYSIISTIILAIMAVIMFRYSRILEGRG
ncbi:carbohydrate ABC transporter permease [Sulfolobus acidocaldarius]|uniref:Conserved Archaeal transport protein n=4 Tax=Sulfolobus acidocaldarius TaxID=2285 RepID=Q4J9L9_SULAC|nr:sugar ABC transporter permease [Sulfolobus acidocaldarius]AAY80511.1 conserved Archaeal transport protein [Sulfolobus acidocaldarius DSM 639]AGE71100.1 transport protein [Sulfolobus acidocaldarius N8]AGE73371.1 transport protein [Sulfolobus acidocaldarius Ron12/I]ALU28624.1 sugar ABC transporter permease [Sulfolobus acidocaldarius]ALU31339.1 sugar ABC transporter permease [Sulfolobus acidocaldarius]